MTLPQNVKDALESADANSGLALVYMERDDYNTIRAHLMSQAAEIERITRGNLSYAQDNANLLGREHVALKRASLAESRLAAANDRMEAAERDAARWRKARDCRDYVGVYQGLASVDCGLELLIGDEADAAIDAANRPTHTGAAVSMIPEIGITIRAVARVNGTVGELAGCPGHRPAPDRTSSASCWPDYRRMRPDDRGGISVLRLASSRCRASLICMPALSSNRWRRRAHHAPGSASRCRPSGCRRCWDKSPTTQRTDQSRVQSSRSRPAAVPGSAAPTV